MSKRTEHPEHGEVRDLGAAEGRVADNRRQEAARDGVGRRQPEAPARRSELVSAFGSKDQYGLCAIQLADRVGQLGSNTWPGSGMTSSLITWLDY